MALKQVVFGRPQLFPETIYISIEGQQTGIERLRVFVDKSRMAFGVQQVI